MAYCNKRHHLANVYLQGRNLLCADPHDQHGRNVHDKT